MASKKSKIVERVRKLLRLAESPNEHEAARSLDLARALMERHRLTDADVTEEIVEVIEQRADACMRELAHAAAVAWECDAISSRRGELALRGVEVNVQRARECYRALLRGADECMGDIRVRGSPDPVRDAWRAATWLGYVETIGERCAEMVKRRHEPPPRPRPVIAPVIVIEQAEPADPELSKQHVVDSTRRILGKVDYVVDTKWLYKEAYALGSSVAMRADLSGNPVAPGGLLRANSE